MQIKTKCKIHVYKHDRRSGKPVRSHKQEVVDFLAGAHTDQSIKPWYLNNYHVLEHWHWTSYILLIDVILRDRFAKCVQASVQDGSLGGTWSGRGWIEPSNILQLCPDQHFLMNVTWGCSGAPWANYLHHCWHGRKLRKLLMVTWVLSSIINCQS